MKTLKSLIVIVMAGLLISCGTSQRVINSWVNKDFVKTKKYNKIFVIALTQNQTARNIVESDLRKSIEGLGLQVVTSSTVFPAVFTKDTAPTKEQIISKVKEFNCDLVFTVSLLDSKTETRYVPGTITYAPYPTYAYYGGFGPYYNYYSPTVYSPGYYTTDKTYYIEANLFDSDSGSILWSVQSETYNPSSLKEFSSSYSKMIVYQADEDGLIK
jgi:hypothetical protein